MSETNLDLFHVPVQLSPRLQWMRKNRIKTHCAPDGEEPWMATRTITNCGISMVVNGDRYSEFGDTEKHAILRLCAKLGIKPWNWDTMKTTKMKNDIENTQAGSDCQERLVLREALAKLAHEQWSGWMEYLFEKCHKQTECEDGAMVIPPWAVERWKRQMKTSYEDLSEEEKDSDRTEADRVIEIYLQNRVDHLTP